MSEYRETQEKSEQIEMIDITNYVYDLLKAVRRFWWIMLVLALVFAVKNYFSTSVNYKSNYVASATVAISSTVGGSSYINNGSATEMAALFPYLMKSGVIVDEVAEELGIETVPGVISALVEEGTNFLTISVSSDDPQMAYEVLSAVLKVYPEATQFVLGPITLTVLDETGIPTDTERVEVIRGSYKRGALQGAVIGMAVILLYALSRNTVKSKDVIKKKLNLMDCGSVLHVKEKKRKKETFHTAVSLMNDRVPRAYREAIRKARIKIMKSVEEKGYKTILVTSSIPGEGKTTIAVNLAIAMAEQGKKVVLVDCDLRNPSVATVMNEQESYPGLANVLRKNNTLKESLKTFEMAEGGRLDVMFGGASKGKDVALLGSRSMESLLNSLKKKADVVILDTAPAELLADTSKLAKLVESAVYVIRHDYTKLVQIREGINNLTLSGIDILGYVYNDDSSGGNRGYGYGYGYGYKTYGHYGRYGQYGSKNNLIEGENGLQDKYGRVIKE